ncbi:TPA: hypothetical protein DEP21_04245 [Patescibacteria group bacterium]|nr:hypothetical protein [Candidatus Gracilibacteria bacterium]
MWENVVVEKFSGFWGRCLFFWESIAVEIFGFTEDFSRNFWYLIVFSLFSFVYIISPIVVEIVCWTSN